MIHLYFHRADLDGIGSALVILRTLLKKYHMSEIVLHPWNYEDEMKEDWAHGDHVILVDISFPKLWMQTLRSQWSSGGNAVTWIDHHKTAIKESEDFGYSDLPGVRKDGTAAIELSWHFYDGAPVPEGIRLLADYDVWKDHKPNWKYEILPFQFGMRTYDLLKWMLEARENHEDMENIAAGFIYNCNNTYETLTKGEIILSYQDNQNRMAANAAFPFRWKGVTFACINGVGNSQLFDHVKFLYDGVMRFNFDGKSMKWRFSLYGVKNTENGQEKTNVDFSVFAKEMGSSKDNRGGGHAAACGFEVSSLESVFGENVQEHYGPSVQRRYTTDL